MVPATFEEAKTDMNNALYVALTEDGGPGKCFAMKKTKVGKAGQGSTNSASSKVPGKSQVATNTFALCGTVIV